jgi:hypothetical protein
MRLGEGLPHRSLEIRGTPVAEMFEARGEEPMELAKKGLPFAPELLQIPGRVPFFFGRIGAVGRRAQRR